MNGLNAVKAKEDRRFLAIALTLSTACHFLLFGGLVFGPKVGLSRPFTPSVIDVSIVSLPSSPRVTREADADVPAERKETDAITQRHPAGKAPSASPKQSAPARFRKKVSLKKKTFKSSKVVKRALEKIEEQVEDERARPVSDAIENLRKTVADRAVNSEPPRDGRSLSENSLRALEQIDIYKAEIPYHIQNNWAFSKQLAGGRTDLVAWLVIEIRPDGSIQNIWFEKRSGNRYFDEQAYKAVKKSDPLPPLPKGYARPFFNIGLRFTPSGLK